MRRNCYCNHRPEEVYSLTSLHSTDGRGCADARVHGAHAAAPPPVATTTTPSPPSPSSARSSLTYIATMDGKEGAGAGPN